MKLKELWEKYSEYDSFDIANLPEEIRSQGVSITYPPRSIIVSRGDFPKYIYFIEKGTVLGARDYTDGNNYYYFRQTRENGALGLLEILSHKPRIIATIVAATEVKVLRIDSAVIYEFILKDPGLLYRCLHVVANDLYQRSGNDGILYYQRGLDRVRYYLIQYYDMHERKGNDVLIEPDYQTIASNIGISVRTVVRSIAKLKERGEITSVKKKLAVGWVRIRSIRDSDSSS